MNGNGMFNTANSKAFTTVSLYTLKKKYFKLSKVFWNDGAKMGFFKQINIRFLGIKILIFHSNIDVTASFFILFKLNHKS